jgi:glycerol-3-phosphate cytidylyltransferase
MVNNDPKGIRVLTCGTFDLFHLGHLNQLNRASTLDGDHGVVNSLTVGVSSDFLNLKKKRQLPVVPLYQRIQIIGGLKSVQEVFVEEEFDTASKAVYSNFYRTNVFSIGDDWEGRFDDLTGQGQIERVVYLPRTPLLSTTQTVKVLGQSNAPDLFQFKPELRLRSLISRRLLVKADLAQLPVILPLLTLFGPQDLFWEEETWGKEGFRDVNIDKIGRPHRGEEVDLIVTTGQPLKGSPVSQLGISLGQCYHLTWFEDQSVRNTCEAPIKLAYSVATPGSDLWLMNQRINENIVRRKNVLIHLNRENLRDVSRLVLDWAKVYNLVVVPDPAEEGIAQPGSTLHQIFWTSISERTADFVNILPLNYFIYLPNLYFDCHLLITDRFDPLAFESIAEIVLYRPRGDVDPNSLPTDRVTVAHHPGTIEFGDEQRASSARDSIPELEPITQSIADWITSLV